VQEGIDAAAELEVPILDEDAFRRLLESGTLD
jgi:hypothetical protein